MESQNAGEDKKRPGDISLDEKGPKRPNLGVPVTASRLAQPGREPLKAADSRSNLAVRPAPMRNVMF
jgi:hypothetical protein